MKNIADARSKAISDVVSKRGTIADDNKFFNVRNDTNKAARADGAKTPRTGGPLRAAPDAKRGGKLRAQYMKKNLKAKATKKAVKAVAKKAIKMKAK